MSEHKMWRSVALLGLVMGLSRVTGFVREQVIAWRFGATAAVGARFLGLLGGVTQGGGRFGNYGCNSTRCLLGGESARSAAATGGSYRHRPDNVLRHPVPAWRAGSAGRACSRRCVRL